MIGYLRAPPENERAVFVHKQCLSYSSKYDSTLTKAVIVDDAPGRRSLFWVDIQLVRIYVFFFVVRLGLYYGSILVLFLTLL